MERRLSFRASRKVIKFSVADKMRVPEGAGPLLVVRVVALGWEVVTGS